MASHLPKKKAIPYRDTVPKAPAPAPEPTFREKVVGLYLDDQRKRQDIKHQKAQALKVDTFARVRQFLALSDSEADEMELHELNDDPISGKTWYVEFRTIALCPEGSDMRYVSFCPYCGEACCSDVHFSNHIGLGEQVFREDSKTFVPSNEHLAVCPRCPDFKRPKGATYNTKSPGDEFFEQIVRSVLASTKGKGK
jgi:hypothetical protein